MAVNEDILWLQNKYADLIGSLNMLLWSQLITINGILLSALAVILSLNPSPSIYTNIAVSVAVLFTTSTIYLLLSCQISYRDAMTMLARHLCSPTENERNKAIQESLPFASSEYLKNKCRENIAKGALLFNIVVILIIIAPPPLIDFVINLVCTGGN